MTHMIEYAELYIGGQLIEKITGEYIYMHQQLNNTDDDINQSVYFLTGHNRLLSYQDEYTYFLDLPFYFYRNPTLAIPTCALTKQVVEVKIKTRPLSELLYDGYYPGEQGSIRKFSLDTEFVYLTPDESNFIISRPIDYVITQVQVSQFKMKPGELKKSVLLHFSHPVKELFFVSQSEDAVQSNLPNKYNTISNVELKFNNEVVFNESRKFIVYEQALKHHVNCPASSTTPSLPFVGHCEFGMYSFSLRPDMYYPTGQVNMSRIIHKLLTIEIDPENVAVSNNTRVYAVNYNVLRIASGLAGLKF